MIAALLDLEGVLLGLDLVFVLELVCSGGEVEVLFELGVTTVSSILVGSIKIL